MNSQRTGLRVASILFAIFAIGHLIRLIKQRPSDCRDAHDSNGGKLDRSHRCRHSLYLDVATLIKVRDLKHIPASFACHADSSRRSQTKTEALAEAGHCPGKSAGIST
jgi:hypothetical protein